MRAFTVRPEPDDPRLTRTVAGIDQEGRPIETAVVHERPLTLFLNAQEIVTMMTIGDYPDYLAVGYLRNQNMLRPDDEIIGIDYDEELEVVVVRTERETDYEDKLKKKVRTSGCAQGTVFGDLMEQFEEVRLPAGCGPARPPGCTAWPGRSTPRPASISRPARSTAACCARRTGRCSTWRTSAGTTRSTRSPATCSSTDIEPAGKMFYTTGRLTSEMVIKTVQMQIPILISRSGFTAWGVDLARQADLTLIGRAKGKRFVALAGERAHRVRRRSALRARGICASFSARPRSRTTQPEVGLCGLAALADQGSAASVPLRSTALISAPKIRLTALR